MHRIWFQVHKLVNTAEMPPVVVPQPRSLEIETAVGPCDSRISTMSTRSKACRTGRKAPGNRIDVHGQLGTGVGGESALVQLQGMSSRVQGAEAFPGG